MYSEQLLVHCTPTRPAKTALPTTTMHSDRVGQKRSVGWTSNDRTLVSDFRSALACGELAVMYQPQWDLRTGALVGVEALARWQHHTRGEVPPSVFISIAENDRLISVLGGQIFRQALEQLRTWDAIGLRIPKVSINVSADELGFPSFASSVASAVEVAGLQPNRICFEITESIRISETSDSLDVLIQLREAGFLLAIDDFGTGYANLNSLRYLPIQTLKIDGSFVNACVRKMIDLKIVRAIISLAHCLKMETIAEGIETRSQANVLRNLGCDVGQGYYLSRPLPANDIYTTLVRPGVPS